MVNVKICLKEMRIKSWLKNAFVLSPIVFSLELFNVDKLLKVLVLTFAFCLISSSIYIFNDINDIESDRKHAVKKNRPIAAGQMPIRTAWIIYSLITVAGLGLSVSINLSSFFFLLSYIAINVVYSKLLKNTAIVDCFCIASGFVIRVLVGGTVVTSGVSDWMFLTVVSLALFMAFGKRRGELSNYKGKDTRAVLEDYDMNFLDGSVFLCAGLTMVFYSLWSMSQKSSLVYTVPVVLFLVIRYLYLVFKGRADADPTSLILSDAILCVTSGACAVIMIFVLYFN